MGKLARMLEVKIRGRDGRVFSRQYKNTTPEKARDKVHKAGLGRVMWVRKVDLWGIMGDSSATLRLDDILGGDPVLQPGGVFVNDKIKRVERFEKKKRGNMLDSDATLDDIVFSRKSRHR